MFPKLGKRWYHRNKIINHVIFVHTKVSFTEIEYDDIFPFTNKEHDYDDLESNNNQTSFDKLNLNEMKQISYTVALLKIKIIILQINVLIIPPISIFAIIYLII